MAVWPSGFDEDAALAEMPSCCSPRRSKASASRPASRQAPTPHDVGSGKVEELKELAEQAEAEIIVSDDELTPGQQRTLEDDAREARRRPHQRDPRHLRRCTRTRRGQAPGRARAARVQPPAHARHVEAPRAPGRRRRHARTGRDPARDRPPAGARPRSRSCDAGCATPTQARECERSSASERDAEASRSRATRRRQVDAPERAHRRRVSSANRLFETLDPTRRSFDTAGRAYLVTDTVGFSQAAASARRRLRVDARGDAARRPRPARCRRLGRGGGARSPASQAVERVLDEIGAGELPRLLVLNKVDLLDEEERRRLREPPTPRPCSRRPAPARGSTRWSARSASTSRAASSRSSCSCRSTRAGARRAVRARLADRARGHGRGRAHPRPSPRWPSATPLPALPHDGGVGRIADLRSSCSTPTRDCHRARTRATPGSTSSASRRRARPGRPRAGAGRARGRDPARARGLVLPRRGLAARSRRNGRQRAGAGRQRLSRRAPVALLNTDRAETFTSSPVCGSRSSWSSRCPRCAGPGRRAAASARGQAGLRLESGRG